MIATPPHTARAHYHHFHKVPPWPREPAMTYSDARSELWLPRSALASCVRGVMARDTQSVALDAPQRYKHMTVAHP